MSKTKQIWIKHNADKSIAYESPLEPGVWLIPPKATETKPPSFNIDTQTCSFDDDTSKWVVADIPVEAEPVLQSEDENQPHYVPPMWFQERHHAYPEVKDQLDLLFHDMTAGNGTKEGEWYKAVAKVKADNPKS